MVLTGRGGFGNFSLRTGSKEVIDSEPAPIQIYNSPTQTVRTGRGGAGNHVPISQIETITPEQYLSEVQTAREKKPSNFAVGRGGSGNHTSYVGSFLGDEEDSQKSSQRTDDIEQQSGGSQAPIQPVTSSRSITSSS